MASAPATHPDVRLLPAAGSAWVGALLGTAGAPTAADAVAPAPGLPAVALVALVVLASLGMAGLVGWWQAAPRRYVGLLAAMAVVHGLGAVLSARGGWPP